MRASLSRINRHLSFCLALAALCVGPVTGNLSGQTSNSGQFLVQGQAGNGTTPSTLSEAEALGILLKARRAIASGNLEQASQFLKSAVDSKFAYDANGDNPARIQKLIDRHNQLATMAQKGDAATYNNEAARFILQQAQVLMQYKDTAAAKMLVERASMFDATYQSGEMTPDQLLATIQKSVQPTQSDVATAKKEASRLVAQAKLALDKGDAKTAMSLNNRAKALNVPDSQFAKGETRPWELDLEIQKVSQRVDSNVQPASFNNTNNKNQVVTADYDSTKDNTHNAQVSHNDKTSVDTTGTKPADPRGEQLYRSGLAALKSNDRKQAREYMLMAWQYREEMTPEMRQSVQENLSKLNQDKPEQFTPKAAPAEVIGSGQQDLFRKLQGKVLQERTVAERMLNRKNPRGALQHLNNLRREVETSQLADGSKAPLLRIIDRDLKEMNRFIQQNAAAIELDETNQMRLERVHLARRNKHENEKEVQKLFETFNRLADEGRFAEAEVIARQAEELDPENPSVVVLTQQAKFMRRMAEMKHLKAEKEEKFLDAMYVADAIGVPYDDRTPMQFATNFRELRERRTPFGSGRYSSETEAKIWNTLRSQKFQGTFNREPLSDVIARLSQATGVNILFDQKALAQEQVSTDTQIVKDFSNPITIESVLNLVLGDVGLVFVVQDESIKITNKETKNQKQVQKTYYVGDLIMPVPNFTSPLSMNFITPFSAGGGFGNVGSGAGVPLQMPTSGAFPGGQASVSELALGQQLPNQMSGGFNLGGYGGGGPQYGMPTYNEIGPPKLGGITAADFTELISLIENTIAPDSWESAEGLGTIRAFPSTLSLIVNQTQEVQDQIVDLLEKLRELNDVQIVVEVRFITLQDDFFERIGIDFDFRINDNTGLDPNGLNDTTNPSAIVGRGPEPANFQPSGDLDIPFVQNSSATAFGFATGNPDLGAAASLGFAILSDIEVFFLIQAVKGDQRTNVTQAPIVTMFNGQVASVNDGAQRPFVTSVTPVVGDFAVAHQPIVTLLPEGSFLNVQAVASANRRFVKMTLVPFFSQIDQVDTFTFNGSRTTRTSSTNDQEDQDNDDILDRILNDNQTETVDTGTTIQLPTISFTNVNTTVSVPDGGTILLGGVKRLSEGRVERGVPFLSNLPFANRLFKNVGIGRETESLMLMVTPRIIIQAEEEELQVGSVGE